ncbi:MAG: error-prone DNA polymerase [Burkholderiales bacterium]|nr:error-prone DNA polymerase [Burkholderiales bacterium]
MSPSYAELHCLTNFSFLRGASHPEELVQCAAQLGYSALAITDECSVAGAVRAHVAAKDAGLRLIIGAEMRIEGDLRLVLLATDREGYGNLSELITRARCRADDGGYRLTREDFDTGVPGCLALLLPAAPCQASDAAWLSARFPGRCWIAAELLLTGDDMHRLADLQVLSHASGVPLVAAGDVHMHERKRRALQDALTAVRLRRPLSQCGHALFPNGERHLRSRERLARIYPPELLIETVNVARRCRFSLNELRYEYPEEIVPAGHTSTQWLRKLTADGFEWRFGVPLATDSRPCAASASVAAASGWGTRFTTRQPSDLDKARRTVERELQLITELGYEAYFLTVHDVVRHAREQGILCQGRGSAANSAVCYCLGITEVDPARMEVLFERFVSRERNEPPDIDVDFEHERREEVIQYIYRKYGRSRAAITATVIRYGTRSAVRDMGKALGLDLTQVDRLAKNLSWGDARRVQPERLRECGFDPDSAVIRRLLYLVGDVVDFPRHLSQHVGGFVISRGPLSRLVPIQNAAMPERSIIQWDKDDIDALRLLKVDVLALGMLTAIRRALELISAWRGHTFGIADVPVEDPGVYEMIGRADTIGVFQIESRAQQSMLPRMRPQCFYDLVIEVAIVRPGPIQGGMVHPYLRRRQGLEPVTYPSEAVRNVLERTLGVPIFQEQVMQLAIDAAGFTPGEAARLQRAMAAWKRRGGLEPFEKQLKDGMRRNGYPDQFAQQIYQQIRGFGEYGFPESHSASFALLVYVSSWLKCHEPAAFTCALLNSQPMGFYAPAQLVQDAQRHGVPVLPPDVLVSRWDCSLEAYREAQVARALLPAPALCSKKEAGRSIPPSPALRLGLRMVKGLSREAAERLIAARRQLGWERADGHNRSRCDFESLALAARLGRRDLHALAAAGALRTLEGHRHQAMWRIAGIEPRPPLLAPASITEAAPQLKAPSEREDLIADYASLGLTLGRHPLALLRSRLQRERMLTAAQLRSQPHGKSVRTAGLVIGRQRPATANGVIFVTLEDETGVVNVVVWRSVSKAQRRVLLGTRLMAVHGVIERSGEIVHLVAGRLIDHSHLLGALQSRSRDFH